MQVLARARYIRVSPRKMNIVAGLIRRKPLSVAQRELSFRPERAAKLLLEIVNSAAANALENHSLDTTALTVAAVTVGQGPRLKRFTPKAFGRATPIRKPTSHITVTVEGDKTVTKAIRRSKSRAVTAEATDVEESKNVATTAKASEDKPEGKQRSAGPAPKGFLRRVFQRKTG